MKVIQSTAAKAAAYSNLKQRWTRLETARERNGTNRRQALLDARDAGLSLRHIADATGLSHQRIHQLTR